MTRSMPKLFACFTLMAAAPALCLVANPVMASTNPRPSSTCSACGHNLIANPGAEAGRGTQDDSVVAVPSWKSARGFTAASYAWSGGDLSATTPGPPNGGKNYFYGGPDAATSTGTQVVPLASGSHPAGTTFGLSAWLGGYSSQGDNAVLHVSFDTAQGQVLSSVSLGPVTAAQRNEVSKLLKRSVDGTVPAGAAEVVLKLVMTRTDGSDNDGMADNLSLVLQAPTS